MNGYERMVAALELREPDQIPMMEFGFHPTVIKSLAPEAKDAFDLVEQMGLDGINVGGGHSPSPSTTSEPIHTDRWGIKWALTAESYTPIEGPIKSEADLATYVPPDPYDDFWIEGVRKAVERFKGKVLIDFHTRSDYMSACDVRGMTELLIDFIDNPKLAHGVLSMISDWYCTLIGRAIEAGADAISLGDDWAGSTAPMMSPDQFREFVLPYFQRAVTLCKDAGVYVIKHCDGNIWPILDMVIDTGIDAINPIQPDAGMDIGEVKRKYGDRVCLAGNVDCGYVLSNAPTEEVVQVVKDTIRKAGPGGGYIMMSSNSIHSSVKPENYRAMFDTTREFGRYPLRV
jgi:uroporphyrinogen decarboxylase